MGYDEGAELGASNRGDAQRKKRGLLEESMAASIVRDERMTSLTDSLVGYLQNSQRSADSSSRGQSIGKDATSTAGPDDISSSL